MFFIRIFPFILGIYGSNKFCGVLFISIILAYLSFFFKVNSRACKHSLKGRGCGIQKTIEIIGYLYYTGTGAEE
jgi:hypothetical protein